PFYQDSAPYADHSPIWFFLPLPAGTPRKNHLPSLCLRCSVRLHGDGSDGGSVRLSLCPDLRDGHQLRENNPFEPVGRTNNSVLPGTADGKHDSACGTDRRGNALRIYSRLRSAQHGTRNPLFQTLYVLKIQ